MSQHLYLVTAGGTGNVVITTITSGNIGLGTVDATDDDITLTAIGAIYDNGGLTNATSHFIPTTGRFHPGAL